MLLDWATDRVEMRAVADRFVPPTVGHDCPGELAYKLTIRIENADEIKWRLSSDVR